MATSWTASTKERKKNLDNKKITKQTAVQAAVNKPTSFFTPEGFSVKFSTTGKKIQGNEKLVLMH